MLLTSTATDYIHQLTASPAQQAQGPRPGTHGQGLAHRTDTWGRACDCVGVFAPWLARIESTVCTCKSRRRSCQSWPHGNSCEVPGTAARAPANGGPWPGSIHSMALVNGRRQGGPLFAIIVPRYWLIVRIGLERLKVQGKGGEGCAFFNQPGTYRIHQGWYRYSACPVWIKCWSA